MRHRSRAALRLVSRRASAGGGQGERTTAGIRFPPQKQGCLFPLLLPLGSLPKPGANQTAAQTEPTFLLVSGVFGTPLEGAFITQSIWHRVLGYPLRTSDIFCPGPPNWTAARRQNLALNRSGKGRHESQELGVLPGSHGEIRLSTWLITHSELQPGARLGKGKESGTHGVPCWKVTEGNRPRQKGRGGCGLNVSSTSLLGLLVQIPGPLLRR